MSHGRPRHPGCQLGIRPCKEALTCRRRLLLHRSSQDQASPSHPWCTSRLCTSVPRDRVVVLPNIATHGRRVVLGSTKRADTTKTGRRASSYFSSGLGSDFRGVGGGQHTSTRAVSTSRTCAKRRAPGSVVSFLISSYRGVGTASSCANKDREVLTEIRTNAGRQLKREASRRTKRSIEPL